jgi:hypothetical protein
LNIIVQNIAENIEQATNDKPDSHDLNGYGYLKASTAT